MLHVEVSMASKSRGRKPPLWLMLVLAVCLMLLLFSVCGIALGTSNMPDMSKVKHISARLYRARKTRPSDASIYSTARESFHDSKSWGGDNEGEWCQAPDIVVRTNEDETRTVHINADSHSFCLTRENCYPAIKDAWIAIFGDSETRGLALAMMQIFDPDQHDPFDSKRWFNIDGFHDFHQIYMDYLVSGTGEVLDKMYSSGNAKEVFTIVPETAIPKDGFRITYVMTTTINSLGGIVDEFVRTHAGGLPDVMYLNAGAWGKGYKDILRPVPYNATQRMPGPHPQHGNGFRKLIGRPLSFRDLLLDTIPHYLPGEPVARKGSKTYLIWGTEPPHRNWREPDVEAAAIVPCILNKTFIGKDLTNQAQRTFGHSSMLESAVDAQILLDHIHEMRFGQRIAGYPTLRFTKLCAGHIGRSVLYSGYLKGWKMDCSYRVTQATDW